MGFYSLADYSGDISIGWLCKRVAQLAQAGVEPVLAREGLNYVQWHALISLDAGRAATSVALARDLAYDKGATTRLVDQLESSGWLVRVREHDDRRLVALKLTPAGEAVARRCLHLVMETWNGWLDDWPDAEVSAAIATLQRLRGTLEQVPAWKRFALLTAALLAGCAAPTTRQAVTPVAPAALGLTGPATPAIDSAWWRSFGDPQLDRLVADATAGNPNLSAALARVAQAQAVLGQRRAEDGLNATLDGQLQGARLSGRYTIPPPYRGTVRVVGTVGANLSYNLDLFGRQRASIAGARASTRAAALDLAAARLALAGSVTQTYLDLSRAEAEAGIARRTIVAREGSLRLVRAQIRNRLASRVQETAAQTLLAQAQGELTRAIGSAALSRDALAALAGRGPDYAAAIGPTAVRLDRALALPAAIPADLLGRRADIAAARARVEAAEAGKEVARRAYYPNINLAGLVGLQAIGLGNLLSLDAAQVGAGPAISLPLFDNGRRRADLASAAAGVDLAIASYNDTVVGAVREAADGLALTGNLRQQEVDAAAVTRGFRETGRLNAVRVASGLDSKLDLVDNDVRLLDAELTQADLAADAARARVQLLLALGGGWDANDAPVQEPTR